MCKKLLVFLSAFCFGLITSQTPKQIKYINSSNTSFQSSVISIQSVGEIIPTDSTLIKSQIFEEKRSRFWAAGLEDEKQVLDFYEKFKKAVAKDDRKTVASMMNYPLSILYASEHFKLMKNKTVYRKEIKNKHTFLKNYDKIFDEPFKNFIVNINLEELWARDCGVATPHGEIWLNGICKDNSCKVSTLKFTTLNSGSVFIDRPISLK